MLKGIDISHHNGNIDFSKVKDQIDFIIIKLGNIGDNQKFWLDSKFEEYYSECKKYNIPIGVYIYCYANTPENAKIGGEQVRDYLKDKPLELPIYIDMEDKELEGETKKTITDIIIAFNSEIEKDCKWAGIYCNKNWLNNKMNKNLILDKYTNWIAIYPKNVDINKYNGVYDIWQYGYTEVNGIEGKVDGDIMYRDLISEIGNYKEQIIEDDKYYRACSTNQKSIVDGLNEIEVNSSFVNRVLIARKNSIYNYMGTYNQNVYLLNLLKRGLLRK